ncbi:MAG TPA: hypothetical protein VID26_00710 [Candidatus Limnocylindrales bacterium]|jgi:hypothetical protein
MTEEEAARPKRAARPTTTATVSAAPKAKPPAPKRPVAVPVVVDSPPADESQLTIMQGGVGRLTATDVAITQGGVGAVRADRLSVELGGVGAAMTDQLDVRQGVVGAVIARDAAFEQAGVRTLIANRVHFGPNSGAGVVLAARVDGDVRTLLDWRGAIAFGAAAGVVMALLRGRRR